jgi:hypothetical protein
MKVGMNRGDLVTKCATNAVHAHRGNSYSNKHAVDGGRSMKEREGTENRAEVDEWMYDARCETRDN